MDPLPWVLSSDSLIVGGALATVVPPRQVVPLIALFGICDAAGSMCGPLPGMELPVRWLAPLLLILWGAGILLNLPGLIRQSRNWRCAYLLPPLLAIDNLLLPTQSPIAAGGISSAMAALGFALGFGLLRRVDRCSLTPRIPGTLLVAAGLLLAA